MSFPPTRCRFAACLLFVVLAVSHQPAWAQMESREAIALQNQILELRNQLQIMRDQGARGGSAIYSGSPPPAAGNDLVAQLLSRVDALEEQVRQLRGQLDQTQYQVQRQSADLGKRIDDMAFQAQNPSGAPPTTPPPMPMGPSAPNAPFPSGPPPGQFGTAPPVNTLPQNTAPTGPAPRTPELALQEGNAALARRDYQAAEQAAREVLTGNRTSPRVYDAQFLLAQALAGERQYSQAAIAYDDSYNRSRKGVHAQDALLGLANALIAINEKKAACDTITKLRAEFPTPRPDVRDAAAGAAQRAGCK